MDVGVPLFSCLGVVSKVDGSGIGAILVDTVDHSTGHRRIAHITHSFCLKSNKYDKYARLHFFAPQLENGH